MDARRQETGEPPELSLVAMLCVMILVGAALTAILLVPIHHDIGWGLHVARKILRDGEHLYTTIIEINPPLIFWFALLAEWLALRTGVPDAIVYHGLVALIVLSSMAMTAFLLERLPGRRRPYQRALFVILFALLAGPIAGYQFGQREHLLFVTLVPYLLGAAVTVRGRSLPRGLLFTSGLLTSFGLAMKPFFVPVWIATEAYVWRRTGRRALTRAQTAGVMTGFLAYALALLLFARDYLTVARWGMAAYGSYHPTPFVRGILLSWPNACALAAIVFALAAPRVRGLRPFDRLAALGIGILTLAVYVQLKGWGYHWYPVLALAALLAGVTMVGLLDRVPARLRTPRIRRLAFLGVTMLALAAGVQRVDRTVFRWAPLAGSPYYLPDMLAAVARFPGARTIMPLTTTMQATVPLVNITGLDHASRFAAFWMLPGAYDHDGGTLAYHTREAMNEVEGYAFDGVIEDFERRPDLLIVDRMPPRDGQFGFDYLAYYGQSPRFRAVLSEYSEVALIGGRYRLFAHGAPAEP